MVPPCFLNALSRQSSGRVKALYLCDGEARRTLLAFGPQLRGGVPPDRRGRFAPMASPLSTLNDDAGVLALVIAFQGQYRWTPKGCQPAGVPDEASKERLRMRNPELLNTLPAEVRMR